MQRPLPPLNALRAFEAAGRHQSFSRAADELRVSHSSISRHVRGLEDWLGAQLFRDLPRGVALTPDGAAYLADVSGALEQISTATDRLTARPTGTLVVNAEPLFATKWLVPRLGDFHAAHPEIEVRLEASTGLADVARYEADIAIRFLAVAGSDPQAILLSDAPIYPYAAPTLIPVAPDDPADLLRYPRLRDRYKDTWAIWAELAGLPAPDTDATWRMRAHLAIEAAVAGQGVYLVSSDVVANDVASGRLHRVSDIGFHDGGFYLVQAQGGARRKAIRVFSDWMLKQAAPWRGGAVREDQPNG